MPAVSIVIPAYNCAAYLDETLRSIWAQTFRDYEVIVVNDGSPDTDALEAVLQPYRDRVVYLRQENRGASAARNAGIRASQAPFVAFLDADDTWEPEYLEIQIATLRETAADVVYPNARLVGDVPEAGRLFMQGNPSNGEVTLERLVRLECNVMVSVTARRETLVAAGVFDESLRVCEDFDLWLRVVKGGGRIAYHRRPLVRYRRHAGSLSSDPIGMCWGAIRVLDKVEATMDLSPSENAALRVAREQFLARGRLLEGKSALQAGDARATMRALAEANRILRRRKIALALILLRVAPSILMHAARVRDLLARVRLA